MLLRSPYLVGSCSAWGGVGFVLEQALGVGPTGNREVNEVDSGGSNFTKFLETVNLLRLGETTLR